ncbi:MAG: hypothetical protein NTW07_00635, partial [candidate division Zixibacteria bacterium]|nr:hypothetical protein [candidate division Zixibacteria bacterium]
MSLSSDERTASRRFQFEYRRITKDAQQKPICLRWLVERMNNKVEALLVWDNGLPYAHVGQEHVIAISRSEPGQTDVVPGVTFRFLARDTAELLKPFCLTNAPEAAQVRVDISTLVKEIQAVDGHPSFDRRTLTFTYTKPNGSVALVRLPRDRRPRQFPVATITLKNKYGEGVVLTNFWLDNGLVRSICSSSNTAKTAAPADSHEFQRTPDAVAWLVSPKLVSQLAEEPKHRQAGLKLLASTRTDCCFTNAEQSLLADLLRKVQSGRDRKKPNDTEWANVFGQLSNLLQRKVIVPVTVIQEGANAPARFVTGYDRRRSAQLLELLAGPDLALELYNALTALAVDATLQPEKRALAIDLLGVLGVPEGSGVLQQIAARIEKSPPDMLRLALATAQARTGDPSDADVELLRRAVANTATLERWRYISMESLLLIDETHGIEPMVDALVSSAVERRTEHILAERCLLAAGCSSEGRNAMLRVIGAPPRNSQVIELLPFFATAIMPGDIQWESWLRSVKQLALDENLSPDSRWIAADVAARDKADGAFRDRFIRSALRSHKVRVMSRLMSDYFSLQGTAYKYVDEFALLLDSQDVELRRAASITFTLMCSPRPPQNCEAGMVSVMKKILADKDQDVRLVAWPLLAGMREQNADLLDELYPALVKAARDAEDP